MKFRLLYIGVIAVASACLTSCSDWFDVSPKTDVKAEELFETPEGFESALAGIYISLTDEDSYGHDMSFGLIDQLAQLCDCIQMELPIVRQSISMNSNQMATTPSLVWQQFG